MGKIETFKEVFDWILYDWDDNYILKKDDEGNFYVNKLYITPEHLMYKTECAGLADGLFEKVEDFWRLLQ